MCVSFGHLSNAKASHSSQIHSSLLAWHREKQTNTVYNGSVVQSFHHLCPTPSMPHLSLLCLLYVYLFHFVFEVIIREIEDRLPGTLLGDHDFQNSRLRRESWGGYDQCGHVRNFQRISKRLQKFARLPNPERKKSHSKPRHSWPAQAQALHG